MRLDYQFRVRDWVISCFGREVADDKRERAHRFLEEALELAQAAGVTDDEVCKLLNYVYARPVGDVSKEVGGVMNTLGALCGAYRSSLMGEAERELDRCWAIRDEIRAKWLAKPKFGPLP